MKNGFTLVEIMITVATISLLAMMAIPKLLRARVNANDAAAQTTLKTISTACEMYAASNNGNYPTAITILTGATPPYLNENYTSATRQGYNFACGTMTASSYSCTATPAACNTTGTKNFTITTGSVLTSAGCSGGGGESSPPTDDDTGGGDDGGGESGPPAGGGEPAPGP
jgi:prepilin-type N-terminal cleavage/methylation domain-containing protein